DFSMKAAIDVLNKVHSGELPFDRTIKVSVTEGLEKNQVMGRMPFNLKTLEHLHKQNLADFAVMQSPQTSDAERQASTEAFRIRPRKMVTLVEELSLRTQRLQPSLRRMEQISRRMTELENQIENLKNLKSAKDERANLQRELQDLMNMTLESPH